MKPTNSHASKSRSLAARTRRWHRWLSLVLAAQLLVWIASALGMAMIPREWTSAYRIAPGDGSDLAARWPELAALSSHLRDHASTQLELSHEGVRDVLAVRTAEGETLRQDPATLGPVARVTAREVADHAATLTGEAIGLDDVELMDSPSLGYQKRPLPVWRIAADRADLFVDPESAAYRGQATGARRFENLMKTIHTMDYSGNGRFRGNLLLTAAALLFLATGLLGVLSVRRVALVRGAKSKGSARWYRWHQGLGLLLMIQVFFWTTSGLSVVWLLDHPEVVGDQHLAGDPELIDWQGVRVHPRQLAHSLPSLASIELASLLGRPVYRLASPGRAPQRELWDAQSGQRIEFDEAMRDAVARGALTRPASIERWERAEGVADIDYYFYTGPFPAWKAHYTEPFLAS